MRIDNECNKVIFDDIGCGGDGDGSGRCSGKKQHLSKGKKKRENAVWGMYEEKQTTYVQCNTHKSLRLRQVSKDVSRSCPKS